MQPRPVSCNQMQQRPMMHAELDVHVAVVAQHWPTMPSRSAGVALAGGPALGCQHTALP